MIFIGEAKQPTENINKADGTYYAVICNVIISSVSTEDNITYLCSVYIPEIYGKYNKNVLNYPVVEIPHKQDADDEGHTPEVGELCQVMFEAGNTNSCRFVYYITLDPDPLLLNQNYINNGHLSTDIVDRPTNPEDYEQYAKDLLDLAYYVTTGHHQNEITEKDFQPCVLGPIPETDPGFLFFEGDTYSRAKNLFCNALDMPFVSYFTNDILDMMVPVRASNLYNVLDVVSELSKQGVDVSYFYTDKDYTWSRDANYSYSPYDLYQLLKEEKIENSQQLMNWTMYCVLSMCNPRFMNLIFSEAPDYNSLPDTYISAIMPLTISQGTTYSESIWGRFNNEVSADKAYYFALSKLLFEHREEYEKEFSTTAAMWMSGFANIIPNASKKLKYTIILCLTICPWLDYPMFGYKQDILPFNEVVMYLLDYNGAIKSEDYRNFTTYIATEEFFTKIQNELRTLMERSNITPLEFVEGFRDIAYEVFGEGLLDVTGGKYEKVWDTGPLYDDTFRYGDGEGRSFMDEKFDRLKDILDQL